MVKQSFDRIKKILCVLLLISFIMSATVTAVSAIPVKNNHNRQLGYQAGTKDGYKVGCDAGKQDCIKYRQSGATTKIPTPVDKASWSKDYTVGYNLGFKDSFVAGYHEERFKCLQKNNNPKFGVF
jgi:hypothetical protein